jgi:hypothetical protein
MGVLKEDLGLLLRLAAYRSAAVVPAVQRH